MKSSRAPFIIPLCRGFDLAAAAKPNIFEINSRKKRRICSNIVLMFHTFSRSHRNSWFHSQPLNESTVSRGVTDCFSDLCGSWGVTGCSLRLSGNLVMLHISHTESLVAASLFVDSMENPWWITHSHSQCSVCVHHSTGSKQVEILYWWISCCWINLVKAVVWLTVLKESVETVCMTAFWQQFLLI